MNRSPQQRIATANGSVYWSNHLPRNPLRRIGEMGHAAGQLSRISRLNPIKDRKYVLKYFITAKKLEASIDCELGGMPNWGATENNIARISKISEMTQRVVAKADSLIRDSRFKITSEEELLFAKIDLESTGLPDIGKYVTLLEGRMSLQKV